MSEIEDIQQEIEKPSTGVLLPKSEQLNKQREFERKTVLEIASSLQFEIQCVRNEYHFYRYSKAKCLLEPILLNLRQRIKDAKPGSVELSCFSLVYATALALRGLLYDTKKQEQEAQADFTEALNLFNDWWSKQEEEFILPSGYQDYGIVLQHMGRNNEAIAQLKEAIRRGITTSEVYRHLGLALLAQKSDQEAEEILRQKITINSNDPLLLKTLAEVLQAQKQNDEAADFYLKASVVFERLDQPKDEIDTLNVFLKLNPTNFKALAMKGEALRKIKQYDEALQTLNLAFQNDLTTQSKSDIIYALGSQGATLAELKHYDSALEVLDQALSLSQYEDAFALATKGRILSATGCHKEAIELLKKAVELNPSLNWAYIELGVSLTHLFQHTEALQALEKALEYNPEDTYALVYKGIVLSLHKYPEKPEEALSILKEAQDKDPKCTLAWTYEGVVKNSQKKYLEALEALNHAVELDPNNLLALGYQGAVLKNLERYEDSLVALDQALAHRPDDDPDYAYVLGIKGQVLHALNRPEEAVQVLKQSLDRKPELAWVRAELGEVLCEIGRYDEALHELEQVLQQKPDDARALTFKGQALLNLDRYEEALQVLQQAVQNDPNLALTYIEISQAFEKLGNFKEALDSINRALNLEGNNALALGIKGQILSLQQEEYEEAIILFRKSLEIDSNLDWIYPELGEALRLNEDYEEAKRILEEANNRLPNDPFILGSLGETLFSLGYHEEALQVLEEALSLQPTYSFALSVKGEILCASGEYKAALPVLDHAIETSPEDDWLYTLKGWALAKIGNGYLQEAKQAYDFALKLNPDNLWRQKSVAEILYLLNQPNPSRMEYESICKGAEQDWNPDFSLLGWCYYRLGKYNKAAKCFITALSEADVNTQERFATQFDLALTFLCSNRYTLALREYKKGSQLIDDCVQSTLRKRGLLYVALVDFQDAINTHSLLQDTE